MTYTTWLNEDYQLLRRIPKQKTQLKIFLKMLFMKKSTVFYCSIRITAYDTNFNNALRRGRMTLLHTLYTLLFMSPCHIQHTAMLAALFDSTFKGKLLQKKLIPNNWAMKIGI